MMTLTTAYALLRTRWPGRSFSIGLDVWCHADRSPTLSPDIEWSVYEAVDRQHFTGPTLEHAMEAALGCDGDLGKVERTLEGFAP